MKEAAASKKIEINRTALNGFTPSTPVVLSLSFMRLTHGRCSPIIYASPVLKFYDFREVCGRDGWRLRGRLCKSLP